MNPLLGTLHRYPFERLRELTRDLTPNPALRPISLGIGEPRHPTPKLVTDALIEALPGLAIEGGYLLLPALAALGWIEARGQGGFLSLQHGYGFALDAMLVLAGLLTALPLIGFAYAVRRVPLSTVGVLQYIAPTLQFLAGVLVFREPFDRDRAVGFMFIWIALLLFAGDGVLRARRSP